MAMLKLASRTALYLFFLVTVRGLTNLEFFGLVKEHATDIVTDKNTTHEYLAGSGHADIDETRGDVVDIPGEPNDEFDADFLLQKLGSAQYQSDQEYDTIEKPEDQTSDNTLKFIQFLINGPKNVAIQTTQDESDNGEHLKEIQCRPPHHHHREGHHHIHIHIHHHGHCHRRDYVKCQCDKRSCRCCLRHTVRYSYRCHRKVFTLESCVIFEYEGKKPEPVTTTEAPKTTTEAPTTTTTKAPTTTTTQAPTTTTKAPTTTTQAPTTTTQAPTTTTTQAPTTTTTQAPTTTTQAPTTTTQAPTTTTQAPTTTTLAPTTTTQAPTTTTISTSTTNGTPSPREDSFLESSPDLYNVTFTINGHEVHEDSVTLKDLQPLCYNLYVKGVQANVCAKFYSIDTHRKRVCIRLDGSWKRGCRKRRIYLNVGCLTLSFSRNTDLMSILTDRKYLKEMAIRNLMQNKFVM